MKTKNQKDKFVKMVKIGGVHYSVHSTKNLRHPDEKDAALDGMIKFHETSIFVEQNQNPQSKMLALLHEIVHAWFFHIGFREHDERTVDALAYQILGTVRDNPEIFKQIMGLK
jgi:predicted metal-dependent peptidase